jgi:hypothetical protein
MIELILQAKRMKSKERTKVETIYAHAAQIYCEMLGQVCHEKFYRNTQTKYQEVVFPRLTSIDDRHLLSMQDMQRVTFSMPDFQIPTFGTSSSMERNRQPGTEASPDRDFRSTAALILCAPSDNAQRQTPSGTVPFAARDAVELKTVMPSKRNATAKKTIDPIELTRRR